MDCMYKLLSTVFGDESSVDLGGVTMWLGLSKTIHIIKVVVEGMNISVWGKRN